MEIIQIILFILSTASGILAGFNLQKFVKKLSLKRKLIGGRNWDVSFVGNERQLLERAHARKIKPYLSDWEKAWIRMKRYAELDERFYFFANYLSVNIYNLRKGKVLEVLRGEKGIHFLINQANFFLQTYGNDLAFASRLKRLKKELERFNRKLYRIYQSITPRDVDLALLESQMELMS